MAVINELCHSQREKEKKSKVFSCQSLTICLGTSRFLIFTAYFVMCFEHQLRS